MKLFRIILWSLVATILVVIGVITYQYEQQTNQEQTYGVPFSLTDQNGDLITEAAFKGQPTAIFFGFTHCPEICPTTLYELAGWLDEADPSGEKIDAYFVTVDPERDTAELLGRYISNVTDRIIGITGTENNIPPMLKGFNVYFKKVPLDDADPDGDYTMDHTASVFLLNSRGAFDGTIAYGENSQTAVQKLKNLIED